MKMKVLLIEPNKKKYKPLIHSLSEMDIIELNYIQSSHLAKVKINYKKFDVIILGPEVEQEECDSFIESTQRTIESCNKNCPIICDSKNDLIKSKHKNNHLILFSNYNEFLEELYLSLDLIKYYFSHQPHN